MNINKILHKVFYPHPMWFMLLLPTSILFLVYMLINGDGGVFSVLSYIYAFYNLVLVSLRVPQIIAFFKKVKNENKYISMYLSDPDLRSRLGVYLSLAVNAAFCVFQIGLGLVHSSVWYFALGGYYVMLSVMRILIVRHSKDVSRRENEQERWRLTLFVGICLSLMNVTLGVVLFFMQRGEGVIIHNSITAISMAAYTFFSTGLAVSHVIKYRKNDNPVFLVTKTVSLVAAMVSMISLSRTMIVTFGGADSSDFLESMTLYFGAFVEAAILGLAFYMMHIASKHLQNIQKSREK